MPPIISRVLGRLALRSEAAVAAAAHTVLVGVLPSFGTTGPEDRRTGPGRRGHHGRRPVSSRRCCRNKGTSVGRCVRCGHARTSARTSRSFPAMHHRGQGPARAMAATSEPPIFRIHPSPIWGRYAICLLPPPWLGQCYTPSRCFFHAILAPWSSFADKRGMRHYEKVKSLGGQVSTARTAEQAEIARFWFEGPPAFNPYRPCSGRGAWPRRFGTARPWPS